MKSSGRLETGSDAAAKKAFESELEKGNKLADRLLAKSPQHRDACLLRFSPTDCAAIMRR